jgi:hypothetical protein
MDKYQWVISTVLHILGVAVCFAGAVIIALKFPDHQLAAVGIALVALTGLEKALRAHPEVPVKDYVNELGVSEK